MSLAALGFVRKHSRSRATARVLLTALAADATEDGIAYGLSVRQLADIALVCQRQVQRLLVRLSQTGELYYRPGAGRRGTSLYLITLGLSEAEIADRLIRHFKLAVEVAKSVASSQIAKATKMSPFKRETPTFSSPSKQAETVTSVSGLAAETATFSAPLYEDSGSGIDLELLESRSLSGSESSDSAPSSAATPKAPAKASKEPANPASDQVLHFFRITGYLTDKRGRERYVFVGRGDAKRSLVETAWAPRFLAGVDGTPAEVREKAVAHLAALPDLLTRLDELVGKQLVYAHSSELPWAEALAFMVSMQPHVRIIYAWHYATPVERRPAGAPVIARNAPPASAILKAGVSAADVAAYVAAEYPGYVKWAHGVGAPKLMGLEHVKGHIKSWLADRVAKPQTRESQDAINRKYTADLPPKPRGMELISGRIKPGDDV